VPCAFGIPFKSIPDYPVDPEGLANRVAVLAAEEGWCAEYTRATYRDWFLENKGSGRSRASSAHTVPAWEGPRFDDFPRQRRDDSQALRLETEHAKQLGIFGSPTFVCGTEIFWGDDRFEDAVEWSKSQHR
jgi:2-hydroxychromene-2-carboxylate isomerase